jgi:methylthioribose-1-phosphate isomerase
MQNFNELAIKITSGHLFVLDQRKIPQHEEWLESKTVEDMWQFIKQLSIRGAPLIAVGALLMLAVQSQKGSTKEELIYYAKYLKTSRPTAVNLMNVCDLLITHLQNFNGDDVSSEVCKLVERLIKKETQMNDEIAKLGASLIQNGEGILTHCNTGSLAAPSKGTALGVIKEAFKQQKNIHVYVDETRPLLQGARLTAYELEQAGIPYTIICDNMAATLMGQGKVSRVLVGADRIAINGDSANKIGTYSLAIVSKFHGVPFHVVAPTSTIDFACSSGLNIPIEERSKDEVLGVLDFQFGKIQWAPKGANVYNPAFDVTPIELIESIILDTGIYTQKQIKEGCLKQLQQ